jgi:hypothetical protein
VVRLTEALNSHLNSLDAIRTEIEKIYARGRRSDSNYQMFNKEGFGKQVQSFVMSVVLLLYGNITYTILSHWCLQTF